MLLERALRLFGHPVTRAALLIYQVTPLTPTTLANPTIIFLQVALIVAFITMVCVYGHKVYLSTFILLCYFYM